MRAFSSQHKTGRTIVRRPRLARRSAYRTGDGLNHHRSVAGGGDPGPRAAFHGRLGMFARGHQRADGARLATLSTQGPQVPSRPDRGGDERSAVPPGGGFLWRLHQLNDIAPLNGGPRFEPPEMGTRVKGGPRRNGRGPEHILRGDPRLLPVPVWPRATPGP